MNGYPEEGTVIKSATGGTITYTKHGYIHKAASKYTGEAAEKEQLTTDD